MRSKFFFFTLFALVVLVFGACVPVAANLSLLQGATANAAPAAQEEVLAFEVAEDASRFVFDEAPIFEEDGYPAYGNPFITQGYIYPEGTITCDEEGCNGVNADGSPEFPELVIGEWTCRGWFVGDGAHTASGPMVITTQIYNFGEEYGAQTLVSDGYELADTGVVFQRAITGGTGEYSGARGEISQTFLGWNGNEGVSLTFSVELQQ